MPVTIELEFLMRTPPENVRRLARFVGVRAAGKDHAQLCWDVYRRINRRRP